MKLLYLKQLLFVAAMLFAVDVYSQCMITRTITGNTPVCQYTSASYTTESGMSGYSWSVTGGTIISPGPPHGSGISVYWQTGGLQTISVTYTDTNSCTSGTSKNISVSANPPPTINGNDNGCQNSTGNIYSTIVGQSNYSWAISAGGTITAGQGTHAITVTWNTAGNQTIALYYTGTNGCLSPGGSKSIIVSPLTASITGNSTPCISTQHAYTTQSGKSSYNWSVTGGSIVSGAGTSSINVFWNSVGPQSVSVSYSDPSSCIATPSVTQNITVTNPPTPTITGNSTPCQHTNYIYTTEPGMTSYSWNIPGSFASGVVISGEGTNSVTVKWTGSGARSINVNYVSTGGCYAASPTSYNVNVTPLSFPSISGPSTLCQGVSGTYSAAAGQSTYNWSAPGGTIVSGTGTNTVNVIWDSSGSKTISLNYGVVNGCQTPTSPYYVDVKGIPSLTSIQATTVCSNQILGFNLTANMSATYTWVAANNPNVTGESLTLQSGSTINNNLVNNTTTLQDVVYTVVPTATSNGCVGNPSLLTVTVLPLSIVTSPATGTFCSQTPGNHALTANVAVNFFQWRAADNPNTTGESLSTMWGAVINDNITNTSTVPQTVVYTVTPYNSACPGTPQTVTITVNQIATLNNSDPVTICSGTTLNYSLSSNVPASFSWKTTATPHIDGESSTPQNTALINNTLVNNLSNDATLYYQVTSTATTGGCTLIKNIPVTIHPKNTITAWDLSVCSNNGLNQTVYTTLPSTFAWSATDNPNVTGESTTTQTTALISDVIRNLTAINQQVVYSVTATHTASGCITPVKIFTATISPEPVITSAAVANICTNNYVNHTFTSSFPIIFFWKAMDNPNVSGESVTERTGANLNDILYNPTTATQQVSYTVKPRLQMYGCYGTTQTLTVNVNVIPSVTTPNKNICSGQSTDLVLTSGTSGATYTWTVHSKSATVIGVNVGESGITNTINHILTNSSTTEAGTVTYRVTPTANGCIGGPYTIYVTVNPKPTVSVSPSVSTICNGGLGVVLTASGASSYSWSPTTGLSSTTGATVTATPTITTTYTVTGTNSTGCSNTAQVIVTVKPNPSVTNTNKTICSGDSINLSLTSDVSGTTFSWVVQSKSSTISGTTVGATGTSSFINHVLTNSSSTVTGSVVYRITPTANSCAGNYKDIMVLVNTNISKPTITILDSVCDQYVTLTANASGATSYQWSTSNTSQTVNMLSSGTYTVTAFNSNGCSRISNPITITIPTCDPNPCGPYEYSVNGRVPDPPCLEEIQKTEIIISETTAYPNPADAEIIVHLPSPAEYDIPVKMYSQFGQTVHLMSIHKGEVKIELTTRDLTGGIYLIQLQLRGQKSFNRKVLVAHTR